MDFRYFNYINLNTPYYINNVYDDNKFHVDAMRKGYKKIEDAHWINYLYDFKNLPIQGWKIHISTSLEYAQETLNIVSQYLFKYNISFKFVKSYQQLVKKNSKYADRIASGKFITIYPIDNNQFIKLLQELKVILKNYPLGPYILTDKRWYDTNIYFRYGAFKSMFFYENGKKVYAIKDSNGRLIEDIRKPSYNLPYFVNEPIEIQNMDKHMSENTNVVSILEKYTIEKVLHYSNGGGVYLATYEDGNKYIIKEGRFACGLDTLENDAFQRLKREAECLYKLNEVKYVVNIYDFFKEWEHNFIVEEYIEGVTLNKWIVDNYPFYSNKHNLEYRNKALYILKQLYKALSEIHSEGIGIGDLSPNNIMIDKNNNIKLIDLETAMSDSYKDTPIELNTLGFSGSRNMNRKQNDWFALLRIARLAFLPIGPVQDISLGILRTHDQLIEHYFGLKPLELIRKIEKKCHFMNVKPMTNFFNYNYSMDNLYNLEEIKSRILYKIKNIDFSQKKLIFGDIRQYEIQNGEKNILNGDYGVIFTLNRIGEKSRDIKEWSLNQNTASIINMNESLFLGKIGIATSLWENQEKDRAIKILESMKFYKQYKDVTITSGLSGIGLAFIGFSYEKELEKYLKCAIEIGLKLEKLLEQNEHIQSYDADITNIGLMNGWSGVSLFFSALYKRTYNKKWLNLAQKSLLKDLDKGYYNTNDGTYHLDDTYRMMPYLDGGSAGLALALIEFECLSEKFHYSREIGGIRQLASSKAFYNIGLFRGSLGIIDVARAIDKHNNKNFNLNLLNKLKTHFIFTENEVLCPGEFNYRLSDDLFSGSLGALLVLESIKNNNNFLWMPVPNIEKVFSSN
ncbi:serine/threonine protein kinase [Staphylococcus pseudintermedius]|uniref:class III lanthionine synthetase LanKC n=1 Tax=Staphylococcus TaxID=1279 RepID=UPI0019E45527|nr:class III lanthionine synthetase LanKC [Staphylococcus pseudintermedius]EGQ3940689.1 serine/threonine protein kinase [Staphylococcus pseudintermedius]MDF0070695.1 class III lanthionine synthetase LanKC [Staphylococcus pseudintermedius]MDF0082654.1 class III lanthionine synthetase LanKC [Staphylococcus pseudintermedius]